MLEETGFQIAILPELFEFSMSSGVKVSLDYIDLLEITMDGTVISPVVSSDWKVVVPMNLVLLLCLAVCLQRAWSLTIDTSAGIQKNNEWSSQTFW